MKQPKITQDNVHLLLPGKIALLADMLLRNNNATDMVEALDIIYTSPVYALLEQESTKYWWLGTTTLYHDLLAARAARQ